MPPLRELGLADPTPAELAEKALRDRDRHALATMKTTVLPILWGEFPELATAGAEARGALLGAGEPSAEEAVRGNSELRAALAAFGRVLNEVMG